MSIRVQNISLVYVGATLVALDMLRAALQAPCRALLVVRVGIVRCCPCIDGSMPVTGRLRYNFEVHRMLLWDIQLANFVTVHCRDFLPAR